MLQIPEKKSEQFHARQHFNIDGHSDWSTWE